METTLTVGQLRALLVGVSDEMEVHIPVCSWADDEYGYVPALGAGVRDLEVGFDEDGNEIEEPVTRPFFCLEDM